MNRSEVAQLEDLGLEDLRSEWGRRYGAPPRLRSPELLRSLLAFRMQADAQGGFDRRTIELLRRNGAASDAMPSGTRLVREWRGVRHEVEVGEEGFIYSGRRWKSLSEIARAITGSRWNGPRFFGMRPA